MTSSVAFTDQTLGRQRTTDGLWLHRGALDLRGGATVGDLVVNGSLHATGPTTLDSSLGVTGSTTLSGTLGVVGSVTLSGDLGVGGTLVVTGNTTLGYATVNGNLGVGGAVSSNYQLNAYKAVVGPLTTWFNEHQIQILSNAGYQTGIGFHEQGNSATTLYKPSGDQHNLRIHGNDGVDYPVLGAPNSAQQLLGSWYNPSGWSLPQTGVWTESEIRVTYTNGTGLLRYEFQVTVECPSPPPAPVYLGLGLDGGLNWPSLVIYSPPAAGYVNTLSGRMYYQPPSAGTHRVGVFVYGNAGAHFTSSANSGLWVTEQKA
jgi:hypothetical protein